VYDRRGRLARSVTTRESEWTEQDRAELLALALYRAQLCPCGCGYRADDTTSDEATSGITFTASRVTCRARLALVEAQRAVDEGKKPSPNAAARLWRVQMRKG
jgi:hypothetical protein